jgi:hypothetical protein
LSESKLSKRQSINSPISDCDFLSISLFIVFFLNDKSRMNLFNDK